MFFSRLAGTEVRSLCAQGTSAASNPTLQITFHLDKEDLPGSPSEFSQKGFSNSWVVGTASLQEVRIYLEEPWQIPAACVRRQGIFTTQKSGPASYS